MQDSPLIASLVDDLAPVRPLRKGTGLAWVALAFAATVAAVAALFGMDESRMAGDVPELFVIANGLLLLTGAATALATVTMASPRVGASHDGPRWAMAALALIPLAALFAWVAPGPSHLAMSMTMVDLDCAAKAMASATLVAVTLGLWLRRGAPVAPERAGLYLGVAAGALGAAAYGLACPLDSLSHLGVWHVAPVLVAALLGRFAVPRLIRW